MEPPVVFEFDGEPAIIINGLPKAMSGGMEPMHQHNTCDTKHVDDPFFGEWLEGRKVKILFENQYYLGEVVKYDSRMNWYRVAYEDGDSEDLEWDELKEVLLPLDINIPLKLLALQRCRHAKPFSELTIASQIGKNNNDKSLMEKTLDLCQLPMACETLYEAPFQIDSSTERDLGNTTSQPNMNDRRSCYKALKNQETSFEEIIHKPEENAAVIKDNRSCGGAKDISDIFQKPLELKGHVSLENMNKNANRQGKQFEPLWSHRRILQHTKTTRAEKQKRRGILCNPNQ